MREIRSPRDAAELENQVTAVAAAFGDMEPTDWQFDAVREGFAGAPELCVGAWLDGTPVGAVLGFLNPDGGIRARILGVSERARGAGVASDLMRTLEANARRRGAPYIDLGTQHARAFYERLGYVCTAVLDGPERPEPTYVLRLELA